MIVTQKELFHEWVFHQLEKPMRYAFCGKSFGISASNSPTLLGKEIPKMWDCDLSKVRIYAVYGSKAKIAARRSHKCTMRIGLCSKTPTHSKECSSTRPIHFSSIWGLNPCSCVYCYVSWNGGLWKWKILFGLQGSFLQNYRWPLRITGNRTSSAVPTVTTMNETGMSLSDKERLVY